MALRTDTATFRELARTIEGTPMMSTAQGRQIWDHFRSNTPELALDLGTYMGASAAYMAGAMKTNGVGRVVTVDTAQVPEWAEICRVACEDVWGRCEVTDRIESIRIHDSYYSWWLFEQVRAQTGQDGVCEPLYDFVYLDGVKLLTVDGVSAVLLAQLIKPGGWLLFDDLRWTYAEDPEFEPTIALDNGARFTLSDRERETSQVRAVFDYIVKPSGAFGNFRESSDGWWAWAQRLGGDSAPPAAPQPRRGRARALRRSPKVPG